MTNINSGGQSSIPTRIEAFPKREDLQGNQKDSDMTQNMREALKAHKGYVAWPTVLLCISLAILQCAVTLMAMNDVMPITVGLIANSILVYAFFTVHHEATHRAISGGIPAWRWLDRVCGNIAALYLQLDHQGYSKIHLRHHARTNLPGDPDLAIQGSISQLPIKWVIGVLIRTIGCLPYGEQIAAIIRKPNTASPEQMDERVVDGAHRIRRWQQMCFTVLLLTIPFGLFWPMVVLWWLPAQFARLGLMVFFQWLPHFPFDGSDRFRATRINRFFGSTWLLLQQDYHLIHHLYPTIPWYRYKKVFHLLQPFLSGNSAVIQGRGSSPKVPIRIR